MSLKEWQRANNHLLYSKLVEIESNFNEICSTFSFEKSIVVLVNLNSYDKKIQIFPILTVKVEFGGQINYQPLQPP